MGGESDLEISSASAACPLGRGGAEGNVVRQDEVVRSVSSVKEKVSFRQAVLLLYKNTTSCHDFQ